MKLLAYVGTIAAACLSAGSPAIAADQPAGFDVFTGNGFLQTCSQSLTPESGFRIGICFGWLMGFLDQDELKPSDQRYICRPANAPNGQVMDVVLKYLRDNPDKRHWPISMLAQNALVGAVPCHSK